MIKKYHQVAVWIKDKIVLFLWEIDQKEEKSIKHNLCDTFGYRYDVFNYPSPSHFSELNHKINKFWNK